MKIDNCKEKGTQAGFGLVEIMIALLLGIVIMLGVTEIATNNSQVRREIELTGRQIESAAYAMRLMEGDLTNAAFWGERGAEGTSTFPPVCPVEACDKLTYPTLSDATCELNWAMGYPLQGGLATTAEPDVSCPTVDGTGKLEPKLDTDYLAVRRVSSCPLGPDCDPADANFHLQVNACFDADSPIKPGLSFLISDVVGDLIYTKRDCSTLAPIYRFLNRIYYVNDDDELVRAELVSDQYVKNVLVEGVEMLRFEYGLDDSGSDGQVDSYVMDPNETTWPDVATVKVSLIVRNLEPSAGFVDSKDYIVAGLPYDPVGKESYRRQLYIRTVSLRNIAGRRE